MSRPRLHPSRKPHAEGWLYCRACDVEVRVKDRQQHDMDPDHRAIIRAVEADEVIDRACGRYRCPTTLAAFLTPDAALLDNILYDAVALQRKGRSV